MYNKKNRFAYKEVVIKVVLVYRLAIYLFNVITTCVLSKSYTSLLD